MFNGHFSGLRKAPFQPAIKPISGAETLDVTSSNRLNRTAKRALSEHGTKHSGLRFGVYQKAVQNEMDFIISDLTFIYISFPNLFCQNKVKKNCKYVP